MNDPLVAPIRRLRYTGTVPQAFGLLSLCRESDYQLSVDGDVVDVPNIYPQNCVVAEARYDPGKPGVAEPLSIEERTKRGVKVIPSVRALSAGSTSPLSASLPTASASPSAKSPEAGAIYIPTIPRIVDSLMRQHQRRVTFHARKQREADGVNAGCRGAAGYFPSLPMYHVECMIRYLHLERADQRLLLLPQLAPDTRQAFEARLDQYWRKPVITLANITNLPRGLNGKQRRAYALRPSA
jgi:hypothetical protein